MPNHRAVQWITAVCRRSFSSVQRPNDLSLWDRDYSLEPQETVPSLLLLQRMPLGEVYAEQVQVLPSRKTDKIESLPTEP